MGSEITVPRYNDKTPEAKLPGFYYAMMSAGLYDTLCKHCVSYLHEA